MQLGGEGRGHGVARARLQILYKEKRHLTCYFGSKAATKQSENKAFIRAEKTHWRWKLLQNLKKEITDDITGKQTEEKILICCILVLIWMRRRCKQFHI